MQRAVFLDKDGTLVHNVPYNVDTNKIVLLPRVVQGLQQLQRLGYKLVIVSNQAGLALGHFSEFALVRANEFLENLLLDEGIRISAAYYCPHYPQGLVKRLSTVCSCRKPKPGLLLQAARDLNIDLSASWMIGDILNDVEAGNRAGCRSILIDNGNETEWLEGAYREPFATVANVYDAALIIASHTNAHAKLETLPPSALR